MSMIPVRYLKCCRSGVKWESEHVSFADNPEISRLVPERTGPTVHLVLIACLLFIPIAALLVAAGSAHGDAVWIFSRDSTGAAHFVKRIVVPPVFTGIFSLSAVLPSPGMTRPVSRRTVSSFFRINKSRVLMLSQPAPGLTRP